LGTPPDPREHRPRYVETAFVATISLVALVGIVRFVVLSF
jgi:hypothetical protein